MMEVKMVKVSHGRVDIPEDVREHADINEGDTLVLYRDHDQLLLQKPGKRRQGEFNHLLRSSEQVAVEFWSSEEDDVWDTI